METQVGTDIFLAAELLRNDEVVAIPTETVYGLAGNALSEASVLKIFQAKNRPFFDPLIVHVGQAEEITRYARNIPEEAKNLVRAFWPGPLTIILPKKDIIPDLVSSGHPTVALRMPAHMLTLNLLRSLDFPLAAPSANPFGYISPTEANHVNQQLGGKIPYILDGGHCKVGVESTIVSFSESAPRILRYGGVSVEDITNIVGPIDSNVLSTSQPEAPGQLMSHYAPKKPLFIGDIPEMLSRFPNQHVLVISFQKAYTDARVAQNWVLSPTGNLAEAAQNLFAALREADAADTQVILSEEVPEKGLGRAINDRLRRASIR